MLFVNFFVMYSHNNIAINYNAFRGTAWKIQKFIP